MVVDWYQVILPAFTIWSMVGTAWVWDVMNHTPQCLPGGAHFWPISSGLESWGEDLVLTFKVFPNFQTRSCCLVSKEKKVRLVGFRVLFWIWGSWLCGRRVEKRLGVFTDLEFVMLPPVRIPESRQALSYLWIFVHCGLGIVAWCRSEIFLSR